MDLNFVLLTKAYDEPDIKYWLQYHHNRFVGARFTIVDNDSIVDVKKIADEILGDYHYIRLNGFPNQRKLYADLMNGAYGKIFKENEAVAFFDDDEYFYLRDPNDEKNELDYKIVLHKAFGEYLDKNAQTQTKYDTLVIPHINMSTHDILVDRNPSCPLALTHTEHRNDTESTVKCIVRFSTYNEYEWKIQPGVDEAGHVPFVNGERNAAMFTAWVNKEKRHHPIEVLTFDMGNTSFGTIDFRSNVRLYHYHIKSKWDWDEKIKRGSCACLTPWYSPKLEENCFYGGYDFFDFDMKDEFLRYCEWKHEDYGKDQFHPTWSPFRENATTIRKSQFKLEKEHKVGYEDFRFATTHREKVMLAIKWINENAPSIKIDKPGNYEGLNIADRINLYKLYDSNPKKVLWADKCAVYKELYDLGLEDIRIPILYERYKPSDSDIQEALELCRVNDCILKCNHASGYNIRFNATEGINYDFLAKKIRGWLDTNYAYIAGYEWQYETITPAILVQPSLFPRDVKPTDYQFYCENGNIVAVEIQRKASKVIIEHIAFTDIEGKDLDWCLGSWPLQKGLNIEQKEAVAAMRPVVEAIAKLFQFVRVDLFWVNKRIYFCETTFCPCSGVLDYQTR